MNDAEKIRLASADADGEARVPWREWGPYVAERAWGTVREDYSEGGTAWDFFPHDHARSRAYRWNEDGLAGIQQLAHDANLLFYMSEEAQEGRNSYLEKRKPDFAKFPRRP